MAQTIKSKIRITGSWDFTDDGASGGATKNASALDVNLNLSAGTGAGSINKIITRVNNFTITGGSSVTVDLAGGLTDFTGATITMTKVKAMVVQLPDQTTQADSILVGSGTNGFATWANNTTAAVRVRKGGAFGLCCTDSDGYAVTAATGDLLTLTNEDTDTTATYKLVIMGVG